MASFRKRNGLWQVQVRSIHAGATSKTFHRKSDAERWATQQEALMQTAQWARNKPSDYSLKEMMERFIRRHGDKVRSFGNNKDWLLWDGHRWQRGGDTMVFPMARETISSITEEAKKASNDNEADALRRWSKTSQSLAKVQATLSLVSKSEKVVVKPSDFDQAPMQLNCLNGIVDLRSGSLVTRDSSNFVSKLTNVSFDINAQCTRRIFVRASDNLFHHL